ncbi:nuclear transport factor 2 family protein [Paenibacillus illinoisensis]|uniref:nuclear transport factor 2 family protein n=1 Tax=Paenibacillus illinoisensis TaxID=59845 RepID=UPI00203C8A29|nr:nuclear transport factor 2 family protein [Paenibacillus illinoisensis]MCM3202879.1 nuclear transport factor 2 family protein [Paenibacillus illinoisensis]
MNDTNKQVEKNVAEHIMHGFTQLLLERKLDQWAELFAAKAVFEFPYSPAGYPQQLNGSAAISEHIHTLFEQMEIQEFSEPVIMASQDTNQFVAEFTCKGRSLVTNKPYHQAYISVVTYDDNGKITHYKDYWNPLVVLESIETE